MDGSGNHHHCECVCNMDQLEFPAHVLPAHFDPAGNASGSMHRNTLIYYPVISLMLCLATYGIYTLASNMFKLKADEKGLRISGLHVFASSLTLTVLSSTMVTLTFGTQPIFMFAEPVLLLAGIITLIICLAHKR